MKDIVTRFRVAFMLVAAIAAAGCVSTNHEHMKVRAGAISFDGHHFENTIELGDVTVPTSVMIDEDEYREVIRDSLEGQGLLAHVSDDRSYILRVDLESLGYVEGLTDVLYGATANFILESTSSEVLYEAEIASVYSNTLDRERTGRRNSEGEPISEQLPPDREGRETQVDIANLGMDPVKDRRKAYPQDGTPIYPWGEERASMAVEGAVRANLADFIEVLRTEEVLSDL